MQLSKAALSFLAGILPLVSALDTPTTSTLPTNIPNFPACGMACAINLASNTGCGTSDLYCLCTHAGAFVNVIKSCIPKECTKEDDVKQVVTFANNLCTGRSNVFPINAKTLASETATGNFRVTTTDVQKGEGSRVGGDRVGLAVVVVVAAVWWVGMVGV